MSTAYQQNALRRLRPKYPPDKQGLWQIFGEDPNCDLGGSHHQPLLDTVEGTYKDAVLYALRLPQFFTWGSGGDIKPVEPVKVTKL